MKLLELLEELLGEGHGRRHPLFIVRCGKTVNVDRKSGKFHVTAQLKGTLANERQVYLLCIIWWCA